MRSGPEKAALWGSIAVIVGSVLPWAKDGGDQVWGVETWGSFTLLLGLVAFWLALNWRSPVAIGVALAGVVLAWLVGFALASAVYDTVSATTFVVPIGAAVGIRGAVRQVPDRAERPPRL